MSRSATLYLYDPKCQKLVRRADLPLHRRLEYIVWHKFRQPDHNRPRATWAQIVRALTITEPAPLVRRGLNADTIPATIDVPIQRVTLVDLGLVALVLGCSKIDIDVEKRFFEAIGAHCVLTTEIIPMFGKAVRFEGDIDALVKRSFPHHCRETWEFAVQVSLGKLTVPGQRALTGVRSQLSMDDLASFE
jgi:hypothetical protein